MMARTRTQSQDKKLSDGRTKTRDMKDDYDAFFAIYSEEEGKKFCSLIKRSFSKPKYFDNEARKAVVSMGHIVTGLAIHLTSDESKEYHLEPLEAEFLDEDYLVQAEIITDFKGKLHDVTLRRCYMIY